jgi:hypothetical protein
LTIMIGWPSAKRIWACCVCLGKNRRRDVIKHEITCRGQFHSTSTSFLISLTHLPVHKPPPLFSSGPHLSYGRPLPFSISVAQVNY